MREPSDDPAHCYKYQTLLVSRYKYLVMMSLAVSLALSEYAKRHRIMPHPCMMYVVCQHN